MKLRNHRLSCQKYKQAGKERATVKLTAFKVALRIYAFEVLTASTGDRTGRKVFSASKAVGTSNLSSLVVLARATLEQAAAAIADHIRLGTNAIGWMGIWIR